MKKFLFLLFILFLGGCIQEKKQQSLFSENSAVYENEQETEQYKPKKNKNIKKYKIAVIQSDDYPEYDGVFQSIFDGLITLGWIKENDKIQKNKNKINRDFIRLLEKTDYSDYIEFSYDNFFSFMADSENRTQNEFKNIMKKAENKEIDLVILLGTLASKEVLKSEKYQVNTVMDAVSDPIGSGLVISIENSGKEYLTGRIDEEQYNRQIRLFHDVIGFKKLGVIYEDTEDGRLYAGISYVENIARERGFEIIKSHKAMAEPTLEEYPKAFKMYLESLDDICPKVDAVFLGISGGLESGNIQNVIDKLIQYKLPFFTPEGSDNVRKGVMLGVSGKEVGLYNAQKIVKILKGEKPNSLNQKYEKMPSISININTANLIGVDLPVEVIRNADEIF